MCNKRSEKRSNKLCFTASSYRVTVSLARAFLHPPPPLLSFQHLQLTMRIFAVYIWQQDKLSALFSAPLQFRSETAEILNNKSSRFPRKSIKITTRNSFLVCTAKKVFFLFCDSQSEQKKKFYDFPTSPPFKCVLKFKLEKRQRKARKSLWLSCLALSRTIKLFRGRTPASEELSSFSGRLCIFNGVSSKRHNEGGTSLFVLCTQLALIAVQAKPWWANGTATGVEF